MRLSVHSAALTATAYRFSRLSLVACCAQVVRLLRDREDEVAVHYAVKTVENICSQGGEWAARFANQDVVYSLVQIINGQGRGEQLRATAASTLARLLRWANHDAVDPIIEVRGPTNAGIV